MHPFFSGKVCSKFSKDGPTPSQVVQKINMKCVEARRPPRRRHPTQEKWKTLKTRNMFFVICYSSILQSIMKKSRLLPFLISEHNNLNVFRTLFTCIFNNSFLQFFKKNSYAFLSSQQPDEQYWNVLISFFNTIYLAVNWCVQRIWWSNECSLKIHKELCEKFALFNIS